MHLVWLLVFRFHLDPPRLLCHTHESAECKYDWMNRAISLLMNEQEMQRMKIMIYHNLHVLAQHSKVWINCFAMLSQNTYHIAHVLVQWVSRLSFVAVRMHLTTWVSTLWKQFRCIFDCLWSGQTFQHLMNYKVSSITFQHFTLEFLLPC